jgi:xylulokinase
MVMYGSTTFMILVTDVRRTATPLWSTAGLEPGRWTLAAGLATGGSALSWFRDRFAADLVHAQASGGTDAFTALAAEAAAVSSTEEVPLVLPYLSGERTPINDPRARGVVAGLSLHTTRGGLYRGLVEGIALAVRSNVDAMRALGAPIRRAVAVGGGVADAALVHAVSDAIGLEQVLPVSTVGASRGDAFLAGVVSGRLALADIEDWVETRAVVAPDPDRGSVLDRRYSAFRRLYEETRPTVHALVDGLDR